MTRFLIPGIDPEIEIHGAFPPLLDVIPGIPGLHVHDLRGDPMRDGEDANRRVLDFGPKFGRFWTCLNHAVASMPDVDFGREGLSAGARAFWASATWSLMI